MPIKKYLMLVFLIFLNSSIFIQAAPPFITDMKIFVSSIHPIGTYPRLFKKDLLMTVYRAVTDNYGRFFSPDDIISRAEAFLRTTHIFVCTNKEGGPICCLVDNRGLGLFFRSRFGIYTSSNIPNILCACGFPNHVHIKESVVRPKAINNDSLEFYKTLNTYFSKFVDFKYPDYTGPKYLSGAWLTFYYSDRIAGPEIPILPDMPMPFEQNFTEDSTNDSISSNVTLENLGFLNGKREEQIAAEKLNPEVIPTEVVNPVSQPNFRNLSISVKDPVKKPVDLSNFIEGKRKLMGMLTQAKYSDEKNVFFDTDTEDSLFPEPGPSEVPFDKPANSSNLIEERQKLVLMLKQIKQSDETNIVVDKDNENSLFPEPVPSEVPFDKPANSSNLIEERQKLVLMLKQIKQSDETNIVFDKNNKDSLHPESANFKIPFNKPTISSSLTGERRKLCLMLGQNQRIDKKNIFFDTDNGEIFHPESFD